METLRRQSKTSSKISAKRKRSRHHVRSDISGAPLETSNDRTLVMMQPVKYSTTELYQINFVFGD